MMTTTPKADMPIRDLERLANLRVRWAAKLGVENDRMRHAALDHLDRAEELLRGLIASGETEERYNMLAAWRSVSRY